MIVIQSHCYACKKDINYEESYRVKVISCQGDEWYADVCSEECFNKTVESACKLHYERYMKIKNQKFTIP